MYDRLAHRVGRSSQATPAAVDKSQRLEHENSDTPALDEASGTLAALRDTLLPKLLSGELSVTQSTAEAPA